MKTCTKCQKTKKLSEFSPHRTAGFQSWCKKCKNLHQRGKDKRDPKENRARWLRSRYDISVEDYDSMLRKQDGKCYICKKRARLVVDHNHRTGKVRRLLCPQCNQAIGLSYEDVGILKSMIDYILLHGE